MNAAELKPEPPGNRPGPTWSVSRRRGFESRCVQIFIRFLNKYLTKLSFLAYIYANFAWNLKFHNYKSTGSIRSISYKIVVSFDCVDILCGLWTKIFDINFRLIPIRNLEVNGLGRTTTKWLYNSFYFTFWGREP